MNELTCDVLVCGGGPAGLAAAVAASRDGARVILVERQGFLGGLATAGLVGTVCGLFPRDCSPAPSQPVAGGFLREFSERLARASASSPIALRDGLRVLPYVPRAFERLADDLVRESPSLELVLQASLASVDLEGGRVRLARVLAWGEELLIRPECLVDGTGEAVAAALAGAPALDGFTEQAAALIFVLENVDPGFHAHGVIPLLRGLQRAVQEGRLTAGCERLTPVPGAGTGGRVAFKLALPPAAPGAPRWRQVTTWEREGRARVDEIQSFLVGEVDDFRRAIPTRTAAQVGVRAGRRIRGRATLTDDDVLSCRTHPDGVARGCWPMERWGDEPRPKMTHLPERAAYEIPLGCLRPAGIENLFVAGRCLSAEPGALASARVIGTALATGWAAGTAAAFSAAGRPLPAAVVQIRGQLLDGCPTAMEPVA